MQKVAARVARERGIPSSDYRQVIQELKKGQIPDDQVLPRMIPLDLRERRL